MAYVRTRVQRAVLFVNQLYTADYVLLAYERNAYHTFCYEAGGIAKADDTMPVIFTIVYSDGLSVFYDLARNAFTVSKTHPRRVGAANPIGGVYSVVTVFMIIPCDTCFGTDEFYCFIQG